MTSRVLLTAIVVLLGSSASGGDHPVEGLDRSIEQALTDWGGAGLAIGVVKDGRVVHLEGYGFRDIDAKAPVDESTIFGIGSASKTFGAAVMGVLVDEGKVGWDDRVVDHLPDFRVADPRVTQELTIRDLLCHRSGVETNDTIFFGAVSREDIVHKARFLEQATGLRSRFEYNNLMFLVAGQVAARVAGGSWDDAVRERILRPLGMARTCTSIRDLGQYRNVSKPHRMTDGTLVTSPWLDVDNTGPAGCVNSCAADMVTWLQVHLDGGRFGRTELWNGEVQREMHSPHAIIPARVIGRIADHTNFRLYGLGWMMMDFRGRKVLHHGGATDGMGAFIALVPEEDLGVVVLQNTIQTPLLQLLAYWVIDAYLGVPVTGRVGLEPAESPAGPAAMAAAEPAGAVPSLPLERYTGVYHHPVFESVAVQLEHGSLVMRFDLYPAATLEHRDQDSFTMRFERSLSSMWERVFGSELRVTFRVDSGSPRASALSIRYFGDFTREGARSSPGARRADPR